jgi:hypothetical protein
MKWRGAVPLFYLIGIILTNDLLETTSQPCVIRFLARADSHRLRGSRWVESGTPYPYSHTFLYAFPNANC